MMAELEKYNVDVVFCIDGTGGMGPIINEVKKSARSFHKKFVAAMTEKGRDISTLRVKVIVFRDYYYDGDNSMKISDFFTLPAQTDNFSNFVSSIRAEGGGDEPDSALEALALAIKSDWNPDGIKKRHIIVVFTDASAHRLERTSEYFKPANYPQEMPSTLTELSDMWNTMNMATKRLYLFAPDAYPWSTICMEWEQTVWLPSIAGGGISATDMEVVLNLLSSEF